MADRILIQCPGCSAKLAISDESKLGKKIRCAKCSEVFVAKAMQSGGAKAPKPKPKKSDDDEFNFDDMEMEDSSESEDEESDEESRPVRSKPGAKKGAKGKGKKKSSGDNMPLIIGGVVAVVLLLGIGGYFLFSGGDPVPAPAPGLPVAQQPGAPPAAAGPDTPADKILSLKWLPADTELIVHLKVGDLWSAPLLNMLTSNPQVQQQLAQMTLLSGLTPSDIESVTVGMRDLPLSGIPGLGAMGGAPAVAQPGGGRPAGFGGPPGAGFPPPAAGAPPFGAPQAAGGLAMGGGAPKMPGVIIVVKSKKPVDAQKLNDLLMQSGRRPGMVKSEERNGKKYVSMDGSPGPSMGVFFPDSQTAIAGTIAEVHAALDKGETSTPRAEFRALDPSPQLLFAVAGKPLQTITQAMPPSPPDAPPAVAEFTNLFKQSLTASSFGISVKGGIDLQTAMVFQQTGSGAKVQAAMAAIVIEGRKHLEAGRSQMPPLFFELAEMLLTNVKVTEQGAMVKIATNIPDSAQDKLAQLPLILAGNALTGGNPLSMFGLGAGGGVGSAAGQAKQKNNLKQVALAMHNYHDANKAFPTAHSVDASGKPLLSWRVHVLPYLDQAALYRQFKLDEPWDSDHNKALIAQMPTTFADPADPVAAAQGLTRVLVPIGPGLAFEGTTAVKISDFRDGTSNTILAVEVGADAAVVWTQPDDLVVDLSAPKTKLEDASGGGFLAAFVDGAVSFVGDAITPEALNALFTRAASDVADRSALTK